MSQELERVHTINLGKVLLSPNNQRAKRAINMIKEYARHHMKTEEIKIEETVSHLIWKRGIRHPPRKIRVSMTKTDEGFVLVSPYEEEIEEMTKPKQEKKAHQVEEKPESEIKEIETSETKEKPETKESKPKPKESKPKPKESKGKDSKKKPTKKQIAKKKSK
ncbi:MAG TPA: 50S ribosomal protein L31e [Nitrosopumilaceae archaeon]|nr:50S ribosomal protein L31e [Nitrosopumilaceae archaeon]